MQSLLRARVELFYSAVEQTPARVLPTFRQEETLLIKSSTCLHLAIALHLRLYTSTMQTETSMSLCRVHRTCASNKGTSLNRPLIRSKPSRGTPPAFPLLSGNQRRLARDRNSQRFTLIHTSDELNLAKQVSDAATLRSFY